MTLAEAPTDVLVWLADQPANHWWTVNGIADNAAPPALSRAEQLSGVVKALALLIEGGYAEGSSMDGFPGYRATDAGREAVATARASSDAAPAADPEPYVAVADAVRRADAAEARADTAERQRDEAWQHRREADVQAELLRAELTRTRSAVRALCSAFDPSSGSGRARTFVNDIRNALDAGGRP